MPVYNGEKYLAEAIESILTQTFADFEFVIVDDGSQDGSAAIIRDYAKRDERIRVIRHERNQGVTTARNSGIAASRGEFIAAMDHDDISLPQRLEKQVDFLQSHPDIGVVGTFLQSVSQEMSRLHLHEKPQQHALIVLRYSLGATPIAGPTIMVRRKTMLSVGGYEESIKVADDRDLFSRLFWQARFANLPEELYLHRRYDQQTSFKLLEERKREGFATRQRWLNRLWGEAPPASIDRLERLRDGTKMGWRERRLLRRDVERLIDAMVAAKMLVASDMPMIEAELNRRLESTTPRLWQMFLHWRRHHFGR